MLLVKFLNAELEYFARSRNLPEIYQVTVYRHILLNVIRLTAKEKYNEDS